MNLILFINLGTHTWCFQTRYSISFSCGRSPCSGTGMFTSLQVQLGGTHMKLVVRLVTDRWGVDDKAQQGVNITIFRNIPLLDFGILLI